MAGDKVSGTAPYAVEYGGLTNKPLLPGNYGADSAFTDPVSGQAVSGVGTIPTSSGNKTIGQLIAESRNPKNLGKIRTELLKNGLISKGTKSITTIQSAWLQVLLSAQQSQLDPFEAMKILKNSGFGADTGTQAINKQINVNIDTPAEALTRIRTAFKQMLNREPTADEIAKLTSELQDAQKKNPTTTSYKTVNGVQTAETKTGLNAEDFIAKKIEALPDFNANVAKINVATRTALEGVIAANGLNSSDFKELDKWVDAVRNGADADVYKTIIRQTAASGMPDNVKNLLNQGIDLSTIYSPYRNVMSRVLEIPDSAISLNDPTLRNAIGPDKEMSIYDFEKTLRSDSRWQYTNNAREYASDAALKVLRDFGLQG